MIGRLRFENGGVREIKYDGGRLYDTEGERVPDSGGFRMSAAAEEESGVRNQSPAPQERVFSAAGSRFSLCHAF